MTALARYLRQQHLALLTLILVLASGTAYAAQHLAAGSVTSKQVKNSSLRGIDVKDGGLTGADLADGSVTAADLAPGTGTGGSPGLAPGSVDGTTVKDGSLTGADLAAGSVDGTTVKDGSIDYRDIADDGVGVADLAPGSVNSTTIEDGSIGTADLAPGVVPAVPQIQTLTGFAAADDAWHAYAGFPGVGTVYFRCNANFVFLRFVATGNGELVYAYVETTAFDANAVSSNQQRATTAFNIDTGVFADTGGARVVAYSATQSLDVDVVVNHWGGCSTSGSSTLTANATGVVPG